MSDRRRILQEATLARNQAQDLLRVLETARTSIEPAANGVAHKDLYKRVTGSSSLEQAITTLRRTIETYDRVVQDLDPAATARPPAPEPQVVANGSNYGPWTMAARYAGRTA